jgi:hypothetical protein
MSFVNVTNQGIFQTGTSLPRYVTYSCDRIRAASQAHLAHRRSQVFSAQTTARLVTSPAVVSAAIKMGADEMQTIKDLDEDCKLYSCETHGMTSPLRRFLTSFRAARQENHAIFCSW